ncbi:MAG TPA: hypothetical protein VLF40_03620 [Candidatus Saccharimonadales bacterium]|nr:hypothetical protein [Candidatus Saccharimonadales bacterium]
MAALFVVATMSIAMVAPASASGCKVITNPGQASLSYWTAPYPDGRTFLMGFSGTLYTGDSSSACNDINMAYMSNSGFCTDTGVTDVVVQYLSGGVWHTDSQGVTEVYCNSPTLRVIGAGYANNTPFRVLINRYEHIDDSGIPEYAWPTFKLYV